MIRRTAHYSPPCHPSGLGPQPDRTALIHLEGVAKEALETGRTRLMVTGLVFALAFFVIGLRLVEVGLFGASDAPQLARQIANAGTAMRGDIVDRNGILLATSMRSASLFADPRQIRNPAQTAELVASVVPDLSKPDLAAKLAGDKSFVWIKRNLTPRQQHGVNRLGIPGLYFKAEEQRIYPHGALVSQVVGFTDIDNNGLAGIERAFDDALNGAAEPLELSLDLRIQHIMAEELAAAMDEFRAIGGAGVVLDATTGEILALVSLPTFDPERPGAAGKEALFNRASLGVYEMGSVFKIFTTAMALDQGSVALEDGFDVSKPIRVARYTIRDFKPKNRVLSVPEIFVYSSNIGTVHIAMAAGTQSQRTFLGQLGLTAPARIELPEIGQPMLPSPWREINTMTISYGHGLAVTPVQLTGAVGAVVNGGELRPTTLLKRLHGEAVLGERVIRPETSELMRGLMRLVVLSGTGRKANAPGYQVGGKTGTADKLVGRRYADDARIASFVGAFPMRDPRYVVFAMVDEPKGHEGTHGYATGGWVAAPVIRRVVERMGPLVGIHPSAPEDVAAFEAALIPSKAKEPIVAAN